MPEPILCIDHWENSCVWQIWQNIFNCWSRVLISLECYIQWLWINAQSNCPTRPVSWSWYWRDDSKFLKAIKFILWSVLSDIGTFLVGIFVGCKVASILRCSSPSSFPRPSNNVGYCRWRTSLVIGSVMSHCPAICATKFSSFTDMSVIAWIAETPRIGLSSFPQQSQIQCCTFSCSGDYE